MWLLRAIKVVLWNLRGGWCIIGVTSEFESGGRKTMSLGMIVIVVGLCIMIAAIVWGISVLERRGDVEMEDLPIKVFQWVVEAGLSPYCFWCRGNGSHNRSSPKNTGPIIRYDCARAF